MREFMPEPNNSASSPASAEEFLLVISSDAEFRGEVQLELQRRQNRVRVAFVDGLEPARSTLQNHLPAVILLEDRALFTSAGSRHKSSLLSAAVRTLVTHAPAVVIGNPEHRSELAPLLATGAADYVPRSLSCVSAAIGVVERWLRLRRGAAPRSSNGCVAHPAGEPRDTRDFGEILRHELNNPLTGILGNAELLIVELCRKNMELPQHARARLETIATLAVRMRETVHRLSEEWERQWTQNGEGKVSEKA
jgi:signal transduction histidine kinase